MPRKKSKLQPGGSDGEVKKQRKSLSLEVKLDVLKRLDFGERQHNVAKALGLAGSTVRTIIKNREKIKEFFKTAIPPSATKLTRTRSKIMVDMERLLSMWIKEQKQRRIKLNLMSIKAKAISLYQLLQIDLPPDAKVPPFIASHGWFERFKRRTRLPNISGGNAETSSTNVEGATAFKITLTKIVRDGGYTSRQVFNVEETSFFWKKLPKEELISGLKISKDRLTLLLGGNVSGDLKLKPLLIYHSLNPRALKGYSKAFLPVIWKHNKKAWVTRDVFEDWFIHHFSPAVKDYCARNNLEHKALLILDNAPCYPTTLNELDEHIKVIFLPPNTASILQPMSQGVIEHFKVYYLRRIFERAIRKSSGDSAVTFTQFWGKYNMCNAVENIGNSWAEVTNVALNASWQNLLPDSVRESAPFDGFVNIVWEVTEQIINFGRRLSYDLLPSDVGEWLVSHQQPLSDEDLIESDLQRAIEECQEEIDEPAQTKEFTTANLDEIFKLQDAVFSCIMKHDPKMDRSSGIIRNMEQALSSYKVILEDRMMETKSTKTVLSKHQTFFKSSI